MGKGWDQSGLKRNKCGENRGIRGWLHVDSSVYLSGRALFVITMVSPVVLLKSSSSYFPG